MLTCEAHGCPSNQDTKIDGKDISLFPFPDDVVQRNQWFKNCQLDNTVETDKPLYLCELHFEKTSFTNSKELKPDALPSIFDKAEEGQRKRKAESVLQTGSSKSPPLKQKKLDNGSHSLVTPPQSPYMQSTENVEEINGENKMDVSLGHEISISESGLLKTELCQDVEIGQKIYCLTIQIDKIHGKPCPRSRKLMIWEQLKKEKSQYSKVTIKTDPRNQSLQKINKKAMCAKDPLYPYKCHQCTDTFEIKEDVRQHYLIVHPTIKLQNTILQVTASPLTQQVSQQQDYRCVSCNVTFRNEQAYRNHVSSHKKKEGLRHSISDTNNIFPVPNPLTGSQIGILRAVKFSCRVCSMEFDNVGEVDKHTRTHLEEENDEERKCNICKKLFSTSTQLNEHLKFHMSCTHSCPICSKTFINRTTLKIHLKTHSDA
ncbi:uncharacterized protein LOC143183065 isoform X4 [Calliopsis andreniformis]|uniref:uncharacterized protein LOC143183065 isoform X4 n=1 Tax=Calliopsis andreniformis TaxID=337506 RepID=UPI003FCE475B